MSVATDYPITDYIQFSGTDSAGTLSWSSTSPVNASLYIRDQNDDGNFDIGVDYFFFSGLVFSGYTWTAPNGVVYPVFTNQSDGYYLPYDKSEYDVGAVFPAAGSTSDYGDNALANPLCFAAGSLIATPDGARNVEDLRIGDLVVTAEGDTLPVKWLGRQTVRTLFAGPKAALVCIRAGALGHGLPHADLTVTADHGMIVDGYVINASALVNGTTIDWVPRAELPDSFTVYHVETENHDVILANGAPSETFIDYRDRRAFDNFDEYLDLYGTERIIPEMPAPRISSARLVPQAIKRRLVGTEAPSAQEKAWCA